MASLQQAKSGRSTKALRPAVKDENTVRSLPSAVGKPVTSTRLASQKMVREKPALVSSKSAASTGLSGQAGPRRVLGDLSNANKAADRTSKDSVSGIPLKPSRSRPASQSSVTSVSSFVNAPNASKLKVAGTNAATSKSLSAAASRKTSVSSLASITSQQSRRSRSQSETALKLTDAPRIGSGVWNESGEVVQPVEDEQHVEVLSAGQAVAGLGIYSHGTIGEDAEGSSVELDLVEDEEMSAVSDTQDSATTTSSLEQSSQESKLEIAAEADNWMVLDPDEEAEAQLQLEEIKREFKEELDFWDTTMVAEYSDEIFTYMAELEAKTMPDPDYMANQTEVDWATRNKLIEWIMQLHMRYHMLPETLWIAINIIDRFLSNRTVSLVKLQLVGLTAIFIAAKYEEIMAPSVDEFVYMSDNGYSKDEILKGERIILASLEFNISPYCTPYSWVRRISKADEYDIQTRTLSKFLMEVTLLDHRFIRAKPSMIAAVGMYASRRMLGGEWNEAFMYYSGYTEAQLNTALQLLVEIMVQPGFDETFVYKKYQSKRFLKASIFACTWSRTVQ